MISYIRKDYAVKLHLVNFTYHSRILQKHISFVQCCVDTSQISNEWSDVIQLSPCFICGFICCRVCSYGVSQSKPFGGQKTCINWFDWIFYFISFNQICHICNVHQHTHLWKTKIEQVTVQCALLTETQPWTEEVGEGQEKPSITKTYCVLNCDCTIRQHTHSLLLESPFVSYRTNRWDVWAKIRQKRPSGGPYRRNWN